VRSWRRISEGERLIGRHGLHGDSIGEMTDSHGGNVVRCATLTVLHAADAARLATLRSL
jgi:hypothetical protein